MSAIVLMGYPSMSTKELIGCHGMSRHCLSMSMTILGGYLGMSRVVSRHGSGPLSLGF